MATKTDKKNAIRQDIIDSAIIYSQNLAGKVFLYVYGDEYFEVSFPVNHFLHLTGVETRLSAKDFYKNAKKHLQRRETCVIIRLGCGRLVQINKLRKPRYALMREVAAT